jgi:Spy/CpxP family protein refolding chaperone
MKIRILSLMVFAAAAAVGATQFSASAAKAPTATAAKQGCHHDQDCGMHYRCDADGTVWIEGHCTK